MEKEYNMEEIVERSNAIWKDKLDKEYVFFFYLKKIYDNRHNLGSCEFSMAFGMLFEKIIPYTCDYLFDPAAEMLIKQGVILTKEDIERLVVKTLPEKIVIRDPLNMVGTRKDFHYFDKYNINIIGVYIGMMQKDGIKWLEDFAIKNKRH